MENQQRLFNEEKERLRQKMAADAKAQQEQTTNMIKASMQKAEQDRRAMMQENLDVKEKLEEMQRYNQKMEQNIGELQERLQELKDKEAKVRKEEFLLEALKVVVPAVSVALAAAMKYK